ncbi:MAG: hypothetical protein LBC06_03840 [Rickettsiales bacterium]|jgi:hypothetical protein|nr:hypothetical protein [Rickettsiales bacterium]
MKVTKAVVNNTNQVSEGNKKHLVYFFGLGESIKTITKITIGESGYQIKILIFICLITIMRISFILSTFMIQNSG